MNQSNTKKPPQLPVPDLADTLQKLLKTIEVLVTPECYADAIQYVNEFENGVGDRLQKLIQKKAEKTEYWLGDWAMNYKYLSNRNPLVYVTSPGLKLPIQQFVSDEEWLKFGAAIVWGSLLYKEKIDQDSLPVEKLGDSILDMGQYRNIFGTCRIPKHIMDDIVYNLTSNYIVVAYKNEFYELPVYSPTTMKRLSKNAIYKQLVRIVKGNKDGAKKTPIGILSGLPREEYHEAFQHLIEDPQNKECIDSITRSLFLLCLDDPIDWDQSSIDTTICNQLIHGGGSSENSGNRWFDKTIQFIINRNGINGITYEHSMIEGQAIVNYSDYLLKSVLSTEDQNDEDVFYSIKKLNFNISSEIDDYIRSAIVFVDGVANDTDLNVIHFKNYGKEFIKKHNLSPDSFIQMALQYAYYRYQKKIAAQYETVHLRKFLHGRTEGVRCTSAESIAFVRGMADSNLTNFEKVKLLRLAVKIHKDNVNAAMDGKGIEKHLSGLKLIAKENGIPHPVMFECAGFTRANTFEVETSQVASPNESFMFYGPFYRHNNAVCYNPRSDDIFFVIATVKSCALLNNREFGRHLEEALIELKNLFDEK